MKAHGRWLVIVATALMTFGCSGGGEKQPESDPGGTTPESGPADPSDPSVTENLLAAERELNQLLLDLDRYTEEWQTAREQVGRVQAYGGLERLLRRKVEENLDKLVELSKDRDNPRGRLISSKSLGFSPDPKARDALIGLLRTDDPGLIANALMGLALQDLPGLPADEIAVHLDSYDPQVQQNAALALYRALRKGSTLEGPDRARATTRLSVLLMDPDRPALRGNAAAALGALAGAEAEGELINVLRDKDVYARIRAIIALASVGTERSLRPLIQTLGSEEANVRKRAAQALWIITRRLGYEIDGSVLGQDPHAWQAAIDARKAGG